MKYAHWMNSLNIREQILHTSKVKKNIKYGLKQIKDHEIFQLIPAKFMERNLRKGVGGIMHLIGNFFT